MAAKGLEPAKKLSRPEAQCRVDDDGGDMSVLPDEDAWFEKLLFDLKSNALATSKRDKIFEAVAICLNEDLNRANNSIPSIKNMSNLLSVCSATILDQCAASTIAFISTMTDCKDNLLLAKICEICLYALNPYPKPLSLRQAILAYFSGAGKLAFDIIGKGTPCPSYQGLLNIWASISEPASEYDLSTLDG